MSYSVDEFLNFLKLDEYLPNFINNGITDLHTVNDCLLKNIGIDKHGHRRRIVAELENLLGTGNYFSTQDGDNNLIVLDGDDVPPPLPPKSKSASQHASPMNNIATSQQSGIPPQQPETLSQQPGAVSQQPATLSPQPVNPLQQRVTPSKNSIRPVKPPRRTLPNTTIAQNAQTKRSQPPIPPREDLNETAVQETSNKVPVQPQPQEDLIEFQTHGEIKIQSKSERCDTSLTGESVEFEKPTKHKVAHKVAPGFKDTITNENDTPLTRLTTLDKALLSAKTKTDNKNRDEPTIPQQNMSHSQDKTITDRGILQNRSRTIPLTRNSRSLELGFDNVGCAASKVTTRDTHRSEADLSEDDLDDEEDFSKDVVGTDVAGIPISMTRDKDELISIVSKQNDAPTVDEKPASQHRKSRFFQPKSGYLYMRGGGKGVKRWIEFTGTEVKCYKDRGGILKQTIAVMKMKDVIWEKDAKKPTFHIMTPNRKYTFIEPDGDHNALTIWAKIILEGVMAKGDEVDHTRYAGGLMANPDIEGYLLKEGHNILHDVKRRYVVIKEDNLCYYYSKEDFQDDEDYISCLEMKLVSLKTEDEKLRLILFTHTNKTYVFQAEDVEDYSKWREAIQMAIQYGIGDDTYRNKIQENPSNMKCADCEDDNPIYASINLLVVVCAKCIGVHRKMGADISKSRSLLMDKNVWTPSLIKLLQTIGNDKANSLWSYNLPNDDRINAQSTREERQEFIYDKYKEKKYVDWSQFYGQPNSLGKELCKVVATDDVLETMRLIISGADVYYDGCADKRTPYEVAKEAHRELQVELLLQFNGHLTKEEREELESQRKAAEMLLLQQQQQTKTGNLLVKTTRSDTLKERQCTLKDRKMDMRKPDKIDECDCIIDLTKLEDLEIDKEDVTILILKLPDRSYFLKSYLAEDTESWYHAIRNIQVMGVAIEYQDVTDKKIPHLISECIAFMEQHAMLTEGIYRLSGSQLTIKKLTLMFNQDAPSIRLKIEDFPDVHAVAGLIKLYLRQLPEPLLTNTLYPDWIRNIGETSTEKEHYQKLYQYKYLLQELPSRNYTTLRFIILHLNQVISLSESNKMALANIIVIFGPILLSCGATIAQAGLTKEYSVVSDLLMYYQWLFEINDGEVKMLKGMIDFIRNTQKIQQAIAAFTMVTIFITSGASEVEDQMQMTHATKPSDVCAFCIKKQQLSINTNWGLFEVTVDGFLERLVHSSELVLKLAESMGVKRKLVVKCNYVTDLIATHQTTNLCVTGYLHFNKGNKWRQNCYIEVKTGNVRVYAKKGNNKEEDNLSIHETELFIGNDVKKKPLSKFGFGLCKKDSGEFRYFCSEDEMELNKFIANILLVRYPSGVWTPINDIASNTVDMADNTEEHGSHRDSYFWGRQSTIVRPQGTANRLRVQLEKRRTTLRNIFHK